MLSKSRPLMTSQYLTTHHRFQKIIPPDESRVGTYLKHWRHYSSNHAVSANRILCVYNGFWWYHGILVVHLQDSVGAFGARWCAKRLHRTQTPQHRVVLSKERGNGDLQLVTKLVFCHVCKCHFFQLKFHCENVSAKCQRLVQVTLMQSDFEVIFMLCNEGIHHQN